MIQASLVSSAASRCAPQAGGGGSIGRRRRPSAGPGNGPGTGQGVGRPASALPADPTGRPGLPLPALEAALVFAWSSGFVGLRFAADHAPVFLSVFWRCVVVALALLPWAARELARMPPAALRRQAAIGLLAMAGYLAGVAQGIALGVPAGLAALMADLLPIGTALMAAVLARRPPDARVWLGLAAGLAGVVLVARGALAWGDAPPWAYGLPLLGMLSLAAATVWQKRAQAAPVGLAAGLCLQCAVSAPVFAGLVLAQGGSLMPVASAGFAMAVLWTAGLSTLGGYGLYWACLARGTPTRVASVLYLSPAVTLAWAWAMFGEPLSWAMLLGAAVSACGVWLVVRGERG